MMETGAVRVFISYSHDSPEHLRRVRDLSDRLRNEGVDCHIDQYEVSPPEGWPIWMDKQIRISDFVLVVCTEVYNRRVLGNEVSGKGLGAKWEGAIITNEIYKADSKNIKFVPVLFAGTDVAHIPNFLGAVTRYDLSEVQGYDRLYRHLSGQPQVLKPQLGSVRRLPPENIGEAPDDSTASHIAKTASSIDKSSLVLLHRDNGRQQLLRSRTVEIDKTIRIVFISEDATEEAYLADLQKQANESFGIAFGNTAALVRVAEVRRRREAGRDEWSVTFMPIDTDYGAGFMEISTTGYTADQLAELRARRLLLDEPGPTSPQMAEHDVSSSMLESLVRGLNTPIKITSSPFPELYKQLKTNNDLFLATARLIAVLGLRLSGIVEFVLRLELRMITGGELEVDFLGQRARKYANLDPLVIQVKGKCRLE